VKKYQELGAEDIRFNSRLSNDCFDDRAKHCGAVPPVRGKRCIAAGWAPAPAAPRAHAPPPTQRRGPFVHPSLPPSRASRKHVPTTPQGSAAVLRCLHNKRAELSSSCRATLFDEEVKFSENIDFQYPMKKQCTKEIAEFCARVPHGNARVIRCLQTHKAQPNFGRLCAREVRFYEEQAATDYRLNHRLTMSCRADIEATCKTACDDSSTQVSQDHHVRQRRPSEPFTLGDS
jgi:hypothetical protein